MHHPFSCDWRYEVFIYQYIHSWVYWWISIHTYLYMMTYVYLCVDLNKYTIQVFKSLNVISKGPTLWALAFWVQWSALLQVLSLGHNFCCLSVLQNPFMQSELHGSVCFIWLLWELNVFIELNILNSANIYTFSTCSHIICDWVADLRLPFLEVTSHGWGKEFIPSS